MNACQYGHIEVVHALLAAGAAVNIAGSVSRRMCIRRQSWESPTLALSQDGMTALMLASSERHIEVVKLLLEAHADVNAADNVSFVVYVCHRILINDHFYIKSFLLLLRLF